MSKTTIWLLVAGGALLVFVIYLKSRQQSQPNYTSALVTLGKIFAS